MEGKIIHKELSYSINGILFETQNELGRFASERQVCDCIEQKLKERKLEYRREMVLPSNPAYEKTGRHRVDFLIENKVVLEVKYKRFLDREDYAQMKRYLAALNLALGILVNFRGTQLYPRRVLNGSGKE